MKKAICIFLSVLLYATVIYFMLIVNTPAGEAPKAKARFERNVPVRQDKKEDKNTMKGVITPFNSPKYSASVPSYPKKKNSFDSIVKSNSKDKVKDEVISKVQESVLDETLGEKISRRIMGVLAISDLVIKIYSVVRYLPFYARLIITITVGLIITLGLYHNLLKKPDTDQ